MGGDDVGLQQRLRSLFLEELDQHIDRLRAGLETLAEAPEEESTVTLEELFRSAHSLKGAAHAVGAATVANLSHDLEDTLAALRNGAIAADAEILTGIGETIDAIADASTALRQDDAMALSVEATPVPVPLSSRQLRADRAGQETRRVSDPPPGQGARTVRVQKQKLDELLTHADDMLTSIRRTESVVHEIVDVRDRFSLTDLEWRWHLRTLGPVGGDSSSAAPWELVERLRQRYRRLSDDLERLAQSATANQRRLRARVDEFADAVRHVRTVPFTDATAGLRRLARELAEQTGKQIRLTVDAADVEVDRALAVTLNDALGHLVRNAVDHGIEPPAERASNAKPPIGAVTVTAELAASGVEVTVADNGRGVGETDVRAAAHRLGILQEDLEVADILFRPGISTAHEVNRISGRGVGLDAVRREIESAGGAVKLRTYPGQGTQVTLTLPLSLSTVRVVLVRVDDQLVALPTAAIRTFVRIPATSRRVEGCEQVELDGESLAVAHLGQLLHWEAAGGGSATTGDEALVLELDGQALVVVVDEVMTEREIVLGSPPKRLAGMSMLLGTTQLEDGSLRLVLSPAGCLRAGLTVAAEPGIGTAARSSPSAPRRILLVEDALTAREFERGILELAGYDVLVAADGAEAWQLVQDEYVDAVVSDVDMPRMGGVALCRAIRASRRLAGLPVILVTSLDGGDDQHRGMSAGADAYLTKTGLDRGALVEALERVL